jgi:hypothetical protein
MEHNIQRSRARQNARSEESTTIVEGQADEDETKFFLRFRIILMPYVDFHVPENIILHPDLFFTLVLHTLSPSHSNIL